jgi:hypothetical protein
MVNHPNRTKRARLNAAAPALLEATEMLLRLVHDLMPGVRHISLPDYQLLNEAPIKAAAAIAAARGEG